MGGGAVEGINASRHHVMYIRVLFEEILVRFKLPRGRGIVIFLGFGSIGRAIISKVQISWFNWQVFFTNHLNISNQPHTVLLAFYY